MNNMRRPAQAGQTLIETMVALVVLTTGITAALGLANFAFKTSTNITKQIIATGLAREGIEAVKNMRDTNWLHDTLGPCYDFRTSTPGGALCYPAWNFVSGWYDLRGPGGKSFVLDTNSSTGPFWQLTQESNNFTLFFDAPGANGFYKVNGSTPSDYYRQIVITDDTTAPYFDKDTGPRLKVLSRVWWKDKNCPTVTASVFPTTGACRVQLETYLTNWKNY